MTQPTPLPAIWRCDCGQWTDGAHAWGSLTEARRHGAMDYERKHPCPDCRAGRQSPAVTLMRMRKNRNPRRAWIEADKAMPRGGMR